MDYSKRQDLLSVSTSGKNEAARGIMGKIRELFEVGVQNYQEINKLQMDYGVNNSLAYGSMGIDPSNAMSQAVFTWSLQQYRTSVSDSMSDSEAAEEAWDELEKSIVANIADDIKVGIKQDVVEMTIYKKFAR